MCWRDGVKKQRVCPFCGQSYFGDLGHRDCSALVKNQGDTIEEEVVVEIVLPEED